jgi:hypothetical protein
MTVFGTLLLAAARRSCPELDEDRLPAEVSS